MAITASTGIAACNIGGMTLHSYAGIGTGAAPVAKLVKDVKKNLKAARRWTACKVLILDEGHLPPHLHVLGIQTHILSSLND